MAPTVSKQKRPFLSPAHPTASTSTDTASNNGVETSRSVSRPSKSNKRKQTALASPTPSPSDSAVEAAVLSPSSSTSPISEPDFILAEVTHDDGKASDEPAIPLPLLHRILHHNFRDKDKTRITVDAKEVVGKYVEIFVREAIARSAYVVQGQGRDGETDIQGRDDGFLEVEDLEKTGVQLVLDF